MENEETTNGEEKKKKGSSLILIIVIFLFVLLLVVIGAIAFLMFSAPSDENANVATTASASTTATTGSATNKNAATPTQRSSDFANIGPMYPLQPFTLNLLSDGGARYVKCTIQLEQNTELLQPELEKKNAIIRDIIIRTLTSKTFEEVSTTKGKERLKDELVGRINEVLTDGFVKNIYFTDFVVQ